MRRARSSRRAHSLRRPGCVLVRAPPKRRSCRSIVNVIGVAGWRAPQQPHANGRRCHLSGRDAGPYSRQAPSGQRPAVPALILTSLDLSSREGCRPIRSLHASRRAPANHRCRVASTVQSRSFEGSVPPHNTCQQQTSRRAASGAEAPRPNSTGAASRCLQVATRCTTVHWRQAARRSGRSEPEKRLAAEATGR